ncbi:MAG: glycoside hydrolase family 15 protein [Myxococcaceae bacterium]|nr:glycoside hydrolase family 15 protein [Myxococcaceae bacterium]
MQPDPPTRIKDYAAIGDGRSVALVSSAGSIDWLCWPRFDSPTLFARLLSPDAGSWSLTPVGAFRSTRRYLEDTNVLETRFDTPGGVAVLTDFMPVASEQQKRRELWPEYALMRTVRCERGAVHICFRFDPRPGYARERLRIREHGAYALRIETGQGLLTLQGTERACTRRSPDGEVAAEACFRLRAGERATFLLTLSTEAPAVLPPPDRWCHVALESSTSFWRAWAARARYDGPHRDRVIRSALALKLLFFAPSGAVVAAPTTSLPERPGGDWNWDYRFAWLRDAALTVRALVGLGYVEEANAFVSWLLHTTRLTRPELRVLYDVFGRPPPQEQRLSGWSGFAHSRPVRIHNAAGGQLQLDVYGEVIDAVTQMVRLGATLDGETRSLLGDFGRFVTRNWQQPDHGIWELRGAPQHYTHSKVLCWVALARLCEMCLGGAYPKAHLAEWMEERDRIAATIRARAWSERRRAYTERFGGEDLDASVLLMSWYGFEPATTWRMRATGQRILEALSPGPGLLYRSDFGRRMREGTFGICAFWMAEFLARGGGTLEAARAFFEAAAQKANDVGLHGEEVDPATGEALGNFPQAFTHVGLIDAAIALEQRAAKEGRRPIPPSERPPHWTEVRV